MKKLLVTIIKFLKKENYVKYLILFLILFLGFSLFFLLAGDDVANNVFGTVVGFLFSTILLYILKIVSSKFEDVLKVSCDTKKILKIYDGDKEYRKTLRLNNTSVDFAYALRYIHDETYKLKVIDDSKKEFQLDDFIVENYSTIMHAHRNSTVINGKTIRLDNFIKDDKNKECLFYLSRSTNFNHLVTNRAIDANIFDTFSLRDIYEYGPTISNLEDSKMSNHIGINALVFLNDGNILVPRRKKNSTISKNKITSSIAVKLNFPKDGRDSIDENHLFYQNVIDSLNDRLKLKKSDINTNDIDLKFLGFGQSLYEAGKPQFYFVITLKNIDTFKYYQLNLDKTIVQKLDADRCVYVADYNSFKVINNKLQFKIIKNNLKQSTIHSEYEMSYLCNLWHYEENKKIN